MTGQLSEFDSPVAFNDFGCSLSAFSANMNCAQVNGSSRKSLMAAFGKTAHTLV